MWSGIDPKEYQKRPYESSICTKPSTLSVDGFLMRFDRMTATPSNSPFVRGRDELS